MSSAVVETEPAVPDLAYCEKMEASSPKLASRIAKTPSSNSGKPKRCERSILVHVSINVFEGTTPEPDFILTAGLKRGGGG